MIDAYGISRTRDKKGKIIKQEPLDWVNCIHTMVGGGWETMAVLVLEVYGKRRYNVQGEVLATMGGAFLLIQPVLATAGWMGYPRHCAPGRMMRVY